MQVEGPVANMVCGVGTKVEVVVECVCALYVDAIAAEAIA